MLLSMIYSEGLIDMRKQHTAGFTAIFLLMTFFISDVAKAQLSFVAGVTYGELSDISYGSDTFETGNFRSTDYTAPSDEREWWGGASKFQKMLVQELFPLLESSYPARADRRIIFGQSLGGQFVLYNALTRPGLFWGHIASNPALHRNLDFFLSWEGEGDMPSHATRLFVSTAEFDDRRFRKPAAKWIEHWQALKSTPWRLEVRPLPGQSHLSAAPAAFRQGLRWMFSANP